MNGKKREVEEICVVKFWDLEKSLQSYLGLSVTIHFDTNGKYLEK